MLANPHWPYPGGDDYTTTTITTAGGGSIGGVGLGLRGRVPVRVLRSRVDWGPATKLIPCLLAEPDPRTIVITVDDDVAYPSSLVLDLATGRCDIGAVYVCGACVRGMCAVHVCGACVRCMCAVHVCGAYVRCMCTVHVRTPRPRAP